MRFSRGRSTPERRAIRMNLRICFGEGFVAYPSRPRPDGLRPSHRRWSPALARGVGVRLLMVCSFGRSALALLVAQVLADDHDPAMAANDLALVADRLDARLDLHGRL